MTRFDTAVYCAIAAVICSGFLGFFIEKTISAENLTQINNYATISYVSKSQQNLLCCFNEKRDPTMTFLSNDQAICGNIGKPGSVIDLNWYKNHSRVYNISECEDY